MSPRTRTLILVIAACVHLTGAAVVGLVLWALCPDWPTFWRALRILGDDRWVRLGYVAWALDIGLLAFVLGRYRTRRRGMPVTMFPAPASADAA
jgi:hypothetical protein